MRGIAVLGILLIVSSTSFGQKVLGDSKRNVYDIAVKDSLLAAVTDNSIELWNALSGKLMNSLPYSGSDILTTVVHATDNTVITGTRSGEVKIWKFATTDSKVLQPAGSQGAVTSLDFNIEKGLVAAGFHNKKMMVYDVA